MANSIPNSRLQGGLVVQGGIYAAGTTQFGASAGSAATTLPVGVIRAQVSLQSAGGLSVAGTVNSAGGVGFVAGNFKKFAAGTIITTGGATAPITSTGLTAITHIFLQRNASAYSTATTNGNYSPRPCVAAGTPGSFYPIIMRSSGANGAPTLGLSAGATHRWFALGS